MGALPGTSGTRRRTGPPVVTPAWQTVVAIAAVLLLGLLAAVLIRHGRPFALDRSLHDWAGSHRPGPWRTVAATLTDTGSGLVPYALALFAGMISGRGARGRVLMAVGAMALLGVVQLLRFTLATAVARPRPPATAWAVHADGFAFPSGHTVTAATAAGLLAWALWRDLGRRRRAAAVSVLTLWAVAVGLTRVYLGVHWPTDVAGGWLLTITLLGLTALALGRLPPTHPARG